MTGICLSLTQFDRVFSLTLTPFLVTYLKASAAFMPLQGSPIESLSPGTVSIASVPGSIVEIGSTLSTVGKDSIASGGDGGDGETSG